MKPLTRKTLLALALFAGLHQAVAQSVNFSASPTTGSAPLTVQFYGPSKDIYGNTITQWFWNFGDAFVSTLQNPTHTYTTPSTYYPGVIISSIATNGENIGGNPMSGEPSITVTSSISPETYFIDWFKVADGGGTSTGGVYTVSGTFGQQDAGGAISGGGYTVTFGFWSLLGQGTPALIPTVPIITSQPQSLFVTNGYSAAFSVAVSGTPPFFYQWQKNGVNLYYGGNISGSATSTLTLSTTTTNDAGGYNVIIRNNYGNVTNSSVAKLTLILSAGGLLFGGKVAVLGADYTAWVADVVSKISGTGYFSQVDTIDVGSTTPTLAQLQQYSAVLVYSDYDFSDPTTLGNNLESFVNSGGGVAVCTFAFYNIIGDGFGGSITNGYLPFTTGSQIEGIPLSLVADQPAHPILTGVNSFNGGTSSYFNTISLASGSSLVAHWNNGYPLVATKGHVVGLNFFPPSSDARSDFWTSSTDGAKLMANSLAWVANGSIATAFPPKFQTMTASGGNFQFSWNTVSTYPAVGYQVQYTTNLVTGVWVNLGSIQTTTSFTTSIGTNSQGFYRVLLVQ
jgi:hypothetical protein